tara:strand:- start:2687 stop:4633 length:1947 start_codon:yes stop_codon:yes gene_type:complete
MIESFKNLSSNEKDKITVNIIKGLVMDSVTNANSGHPGGPMSLADFTYILYSEFLNINPSDPDWSNRDRVVLSVGHACMVLYSMLFLSDFLDMKDLKDFRKIDSRTPGHPEIETPGVDANTGPLGQGVGMGIGLALAENISASKSDSNKRRFTYVLAGDGDLQEPIALSASTLAGHWKLSKLIMFYDKNDIQIAGETSRVDSTDYIGLYESMGWHVQEIDGHNHEEIRTAITNAQQSDLPSIIIGKTIIAKGSFSLENSPNSHGAPFSEQEIKNSKDKMNLPPEEKFYCPDEVKDHFQRNFEMLKEKVKETDKSFRSNMCTVDYNLSKMVMPDFGNDIIATRKAFGMCLDELASKFDNLIGGSADLDGSNCTTNFVKTYGDYSYSNPQGRNLAFGVREFPMATIMNGIALYGQNFPFGGTFLVFSDYMRSAIRLSAIQRLHVLYEFTHDSIFVGEDGPTHQPVEQTMSLRQIPHLFVHRPADAIETYFCSQLIMKEKDNPHAILLTRQKLPHIDMNSEKIKEGVERGAYIVKDVQSPDAIIFTSGSELHLALKVADKINKNIRVVNIPCWEIFHNQNNEYKERILLTNCKKRISIEAGSTHGWEKFTGIEGLNIGIDDFGHSAPGTDVAKKFGFTLDNIKKQIEDYLK